MTLSELIVQLQGLEEDCGDHVILMSIDPEGNGFHKLPPNFYSTGFAAGDGWNYEYHEREEEDDEDPSGEPCVCLWP